MTLQVFDYGVFWNNWSCTSHEATSKAELASLAEPWSCTLEANITFLTHHLSVIKSMSLPCRAAPLPQILDGGGGILITKGFCSGALCLTVAHNATGYSSPNYAGPNNNSLWNKMASWILLKMGRWLHDWREPFTEVSPLLGWPVFSDVTPLERWPL